KKKLWLLILAVFLFTGCSVEYNIEINDNQIKIDGELLETDELIWNKEIIQNELEDINFNQDPDYCTEDTCGIMDGEPDLSSLTFRELIDLKTINEESRIEGLEKIDEIGKLGISTKKEILYSNRNSFKEMPGITTCYKNFSIVENPNKDGVILSTSNKNLCFEMYDILEDITIKLKTNHEVESHNADEVVDGEYIWKINKNNYNNKSIQLNLLNKTHKKANFNLLILLGGAILVIVTMIGLIVMNVYIKSNKANTIK
ncbi:MAG: hypothetical protein K2I72_00420, partial [Bacilli bacterium]|nr:hypothetical protein [Bacilli bacterium]